MTRAHVRNILVIIVVALFAVFCGTATGQGVPQPYLPILQKFYSDLGGPNWKRNDGWMTSAHYCTWYGLSCDPSGVYVVAISMSKNNLIGVVPPIIAMMSPSMFAVDLSENPITVHVDIFANMRNLQLLALSREIFSPICVFPWRDLPGAPSLGMSHCWGYPDGGQMYSQYVPDATPNVLGNTTFLKNLKNLTAFLTESFLFGDFIFGDYICEMRGLKLLDIANANIGGPVPDCFGNLTDLQVLRLSTNKLTGTIPKSVSLLPRVVHLNMNNNLFTGDPPPFPPNVIHYFVTENYLNGTLPTEPVPYNAPNPNWILNKLESVTGHTNALRGPLPPSWGSIKSIKYIWFTSNRLTGTFPSEWATFSMTLMCAVGRNQFTGQLPDMFFGWLQNFTHANVPPPFCDDPTICPLGAFITPFAVPFGVQLVRFRTNYLVGAPPRSLIGHPAIADIDLADNYFQGPLHLILTRFWRNMKLARLQRNNFTGYLHHTGMCDLPLIMLDISGNPVTGTIPDCIASMKSLIRVRMSDTQVTGTLPFWFGNASSMMYFTARNTKLTGTIPMSVSQQLNMRAFDLTNNAITGLAMQNLAPFAYSPFLDLIGLDGNQLQGPLLPVLFQRGPPLPSYPRFPSLTTLRLANNNLVGPLPDIFTTTVSRLTMVTVRNNMLMGPLPQMRDTMNVVDVSGNPLMASNAVPEFATFTDIYVQVNANDLFACREMTGLRKSMIVTVDSHYFNYSNCACINGYYGKPPNCMPCLPNAKCVGPAVNGQMAVNPGYYPTPSPLNPMYLIKCLEDPVRNEPSSCNPEGLVNYTCKAGFTGRLCSRCLDGYYAKQQRCIECPTLAGAIFVILAVFGAIIVVGVLCFVLRKYVKFIVVVCKVAILYAQMLAIMLTKTSMNWPPSIVNSNQFFEIANVNIGFFSCLARENIADLSVETEVLAYITLAFFVLAILGLAFIIVEIFRWVDSHERDVVPVEFDATDTNSVKDEDVMSAHSDMKVTTCEDRADKEFHVHDVETGKMMRVGKPSFVFYQGKSIFEVDDKRTKVMKRKFMILRGAVMLLRFCYLPVSTTIFQLFQCVRDPGDGKEYMSFNPSRLCTLDDPLYKRNFILAVVLIPIYVAAFPIWIMFMAYLFNKGNKVVRTTWFFIYNDFRAGHEMYVVWDLMRRLVISVITILVPLEWKINETLLLIFFVILFGCTSILMPFSTPLHNWCEFTATATLLITCLLGMCNSTTFPANEGLVTALMIISQLLLLAAFVYGFWLNAYAKPREIMSHLPLYTFITKQRGTDNSVKQFKDLLREKLGTQTLVKNQMGTVQPPTPEEMFVTVKQTYGSNEKIMAAATKLQEELERVASSSP